mmetsp:Transcript_6449/g.15566  ORF Transcript_6449/g.15566 Transcript_6449/m.15566 type:complete len:97 (+) Transcript_6449:875-1165(+)
MDCWNGLKWTWVHHHRLCMHRISSATFFAYPGFRGLVTSYACARETRQSLSTSHTDTISSSRQFVCSVASSKLPVSTTTFIILSVCRRTLFLNEGQ